MANMDKNRQGTGMQGNKPQPTTKPPQQGGQQMKGDRDNQQHREHRGNDNDRAMHPNRENQQNKGGNRDNDNDRAMQPKRGGGDSSMQERGHRDQQQNRGDGDRSTQQNRGGNRDNDQDFNGNRRPGKNN
jgi:hypothetical protein